MNLREPMEKEGLLARELPVQVELIERKIYLIRGQKVMLDSDLAELYQAPTKTLNQAVKRNPDRFPDDFMFRLTDEGAEASNRSQIVTGFPEAPRPASVALRLHRARRGYALVRTP